jgi:hypothetical protein
LRVDWRCSELFTKGAHAEMLRDSMGARREARTGEDKAMFTLQNTESYIQEELDELNDLLAEVLAALTDAERQDKIIVDRVSEKILAHYDMRTVE